MHEGKSIGLKLKQAKIQNSNGYVKIKYEIHTDFPVGKGSLFKYIEHDFSIEFNLSLHCPIPEMRIWIIALLVSVIPS